MAIKRTYKNTRENNRAINEFLGTVVGAVRSGSLNAMQKIARRGIDTLVNKVATFSDYTGVLINSYQAAVVVNGNWGTGNNFNGSGDVIAKGSGNEFRNGQKSVRLVTSYGVVGTTPISFRTIGNAKESFAKRKERNPKSAATIPNRYKTRHQGSSYKGYGRDITAIKAYMPAQNLGIEVIFNNPTPYANTVNETNAGSTVMPLGGAAQILPAGTAIAITDSEIWRAVRRYQQKR